MPASKPAKLKTLLQGLAVALGVYYLHAAQTCGLTVQGVDFPGHFLLRNDPA
jgi:regulator of sirC expression with transglutaminase-like and TPR domain